MEVEKGKGEGKRGGKGTERQRKKGKGENGEGNKGKIEEENLKLKFKRYENEQRTFFFFCLSLFETTKICLGCTKIEIFEGNFLTSPTFDCTHGYAPINTFCISERSDGGSCSSGGILSSVIGGSSTGLDVRRVLLHILSIFPLYFLSDLTHFSPRPLCMLAARI